MQVRMISFLSLWTATNQSILLGKPGKSENKGTKKDGSIKQQVFYFNLIVIYTCVLTLWHKRWSSENPGVWRYKRWQNVYASVDGRSIAATCWTKPVQESRCYIINCGSQVACSNSIKHSRTRKIVSKLSVCKSFSKPYIVTVDTVFMCERRSEDTRTKGISSKTIVKSRSQRWWYLASFVEWV